MSVKALVTPEVMRWARISRGFDLEQAAKKIGRAVEEIRAWEDGSLCPTMAQARKAAEVYKRPLAVLYLPEPPSGYEVLRDFRRLPDKSESTFSPDLLMLIRGARYRQEWLRHYRIDEGAEPLGFVGSAGTDIAPQDTAESARAILAISHQDQTACRTREDALHFWIDRVENAGVLVVRASSVPCEEARGFALCDEYAPFVFVNSKDAKSAQVFTLAHEFVHLLINMCGVSNLEDSGRWQTPEAKAVEIFCNRVAGHIILPDQVFDHIWASLPTGELVEDRIEKVADRCKVSSEVVARRLLDRQIVSEDKYKELRDVYSNRWMEFQESESQVRRSKKETPRLYYPLTAMRNGYTFTRIVLGAYFSGTISGREASSVLDVKVDKFGRLARQVGIHGRIAQGGVGP